MTECYAEKAAVQVKNMYSGFFSCAPPGTQEKHDASPGKQVLSGAGIMFSQVTGFLENIAKILRRITKKYPTNEKCAIIQLLYTTR